MISISAFKLACCSSKAMFTHISWTSSSCSLCTNDDFTIFQFWRWALGVISVSSNVKGWRIRVWCHGTVESNNAFLISNEPKICMIVTYSVLICSWHNPIWLQKLYVCSRFCTNFLASTINCKSGPFQSRCIKAWCSQTKSTAFILSSLIHHFAFFGVLNTIV